MNPSTQAEALYDILIYHAAVRLAPFVEMVTHSATVNHGGGLRKTHERVFANPCYYAQSMFAAFADATPVKTDLTCATEKAPMVLPDLRHVTKSRTGKVLDVLAAESSDGTLLLSIVAQRHPATHRPEDRVGWSGRRRDSTDSDALGQRALGSQYAGDADSHCARRQREGASAAQSYRSDLPPYSYTLVRIPQRQRQG